MKYNLKEIGSSSQKNQLVSEICVVNLHDSMMGMCV